MAVVVVIVGYLLGCIPTAYLAGRMSRRVDIRRLGDENMGAANVFRKLSKSTGIIVGVIDGCKGMLAILIAKATEMPQSIVLITGLAVVAGHNWPVFLGFRGGRGVSTTLGTLYILVTAPMLILTLPVIAILVLKKSVNWAMAFAFILLPVVDWWFKVPLTLILYGLAMAVLIGITTLFRNRARAKEMRPA